MEATLTEDGQITLPKEIREQLHLTPGDQVKIFVHGNGHAIILPVLPISSLKGILRGRVDRVVTVEEMDEAIAEEVAAQYERSIEK